jgi:hypothetical protein
MKIKESYEQLTDGEKYVVKGAGIIIVIMIIFAFL